MVEILTAVKIEPLEEIEYQLSNDEGLELMAQVCVVAKAMEVVQDVVRKLMDHAQSVRTHSLLECCNPYLCPS